MHFFQLIDREPFPVVATQMRNRLTRIVLATVWALWVCLGVDVALADNNLGLDIQGVSGELAKNIERHVELLNITSRQAARQQRNQVLAKAYTALQALGYYDAKVTFALSPPERSSTRMILVVVLGEPVRWKDTRVTLSGPGMEDPLFQKTIQKFGPRKGDVLNHQQYEALKKQLRTQALSYGYFDVFTRRQKLLVDRAEHSAVIDLEIVTGERYRFGDVSFSPTQLNESYLQRLIPFAPGDYYEETKLTEFNRNLLDTGYFRTVGLVPDHQKGSIGADAVVPVTVELDDNAFNRVSVGAGYGTDTGPRVRLSWLMPMLNQYGHSLQFATALSEPRQEFTSEYKIPDGKPGTDFWSLQTGYLEERFVDNQYRQVSAGISRQQQVWDNWSRTYFTKFKREQGHIEGDDIETSLPSDAFFITPGISFSQLVTKGGLNVRSGHKYNLDLEFSDPSIGSDTEYLRVTGQAKWLTPISARQQILLRLQLGMLWSQDFNQVPVSARFFAGGDQSIRGYAYNSIGPHNADDALIGGSRLAIVSAEYLYQFLPNWKAALFADHGGAMDETNQPIETGVGVGVRWLSPLGVIGVDVANAISDDQRFRLHVTMGTTL